MQRISVFLLLILVGVAASHKTVRASPNAPASPVVFDGLGLEDFKGSGSIASALQGLEADASPADLPLGVPVDVVVRGPSGRGNGSDPLAAEMKSQVEGIGASGRTNLNQGELLWPPFLDSPQLAWLSPCRLRRDQGWSNLPSLSFAERRQGRGG